MTWRPSRRSGRSVFPTRAQTPRTDSNIRQGRRGFPETSFPSRHIPCVRGIGSPPGGQAGYGRRS
jgi:hypothetical protein